MKSQLICKYIMKWIRFPCWKCDAIRVTKIHTYRIRRTDDEEITFENVKSDACELGGLKSMLVYELLFPFAFHEAIRHFIYETILNRRNISWNFTFYGYFISSGCFNYFPECCSLNFSASNSQNIQHGI